MKKEEEKKEEEEEVEEKGGDHREKGLSCHWALGRECQAQMWAVRSGERSRSPGDAQKERRPGMSPNEPAFKKGVQEEALAEKMGELGKWEETRKDKTLSRGAIRSAQQENLDLTTSRS